MGMRKGKTLLILLVILLAATCGALAESRTVKVGSFDHFPVIFRDADGKTRGLYSDLLTEIGKRENIEFIYIFGTLNEGLERIKTGEIDLLTSVAFTNERAAYLDFCGEPLLTVWGELYAPHDSKINGLLDIQAKTIGILKGDINAKNFQYLVETFGFTCAFIEYATYEEVFAATASAKVNAGVTGTTFGAAMQKSYKLKSTGIMFNPVNIYFATAKEKNLELRFLIDSHILKWKHEENSPLNRAKSKWLYGPDSKQASIPSWLINALIALGLAAAIAVVFVTVFITLLGQKVRQATEQYRESEEIFSQFLKHSPIYIFFKDAEIRPLRLSENYIDMIGRPVSELIGKTMTDIFPEDLAAKMIEDDKKILADGKPVTIEEELNGRKYTTVKFSFQLANKKKYLAGYTIDITEAREAEEKIRYLLTEKDLLLKEVHHRIKNNMTSIKGLLSLQIEAEKNESAAQSLRDAESRVQSIIMLYDKLYCTENYRELSCREYLLPLTSDIVHSFPNGKSVTLEANVTDYVMNVQLLTPLGIIINELLTNAMKHAFTGRETGQITLDMSEREKRIRIEFSDNGIGIAETANLENSHGFGMQIVCMLVEQMGGTILIERKEGTKFAIEFTAS